MKYEMLRSIAIWLFCIMWITVSVFNHIHMDKIKVLKSELLTKNQKIVHLESIIKQKDTKIKELQTIIDEFSKVTVKGTSYTNAKDETNEDNENTACMVNPSIGSIAVSQDLFYKGWTCGKKVKIKHLGIFTIRKIKDVMHNRKEKQIDIVTETKEQAYRFGVVHNLKAVLLTNYENM